jgi:ABC-type transporter Mla subunit MlaD
VTGFGFPRIPGVPGLGELLELLQKQTEALAQLPRTLTELTSTVRELVATTASARDTVASAQRTADRLEQLVEELEEPVRALRPGLERLARVLDDPAVDTIPDTVRQLSSDLVPLVHGLREAQARVGTVTGLLTRRRPRPDSPDDVRPDGG